MNQPLSPGRVMVNTAAVLLVIGIAWVLIQIRPILIILLLGIILGTAIDPLVMRLRRFGLSRGQGILVVYAGIISLLAAAIYFIIPPLVRQAVDLFNDVPNIVANLREQASASNSEFIRTTGVRSLDRGLRAYEEFRESPPIEGSMAYAFATSVVGIVFTTFSVLIVAFYWMTEKAIIKRLVLDLFPLDKRERAHAVWDEIEFKLGGWTRGQSILCVALGVTSAIAYWAIGLEFWLALGIWAGLTGLIPFIGPVLGGSAAFIVALADSWQKALMVIVIILILQQLEGAVLVPRVMRNAVGMTPLSVILAVFIGGTLLGIIGAVIAIPIAAALQVLIQALLRSRAEQDSDDEPWAGVVASSAPARSPETQPAEPSSG
ncbi:MAG TPA: AI-2E family transporter [Thermomicrobiales bacterium]|nr:AI-2E family transporter [Thermomicrobiales bacterium]